ncbi:uncharacterized protein LOC143217942 [Lasioglossum baleicum]|uniref:uncharacterized protein LOC143217942 n=1 Tax=Lasioglossum baleicum TaxID=434251 RepID=UPI003FCDB121
MDSMDSINIGETPHSSTSHDSVDSGYLTLTPHSFTPVTGCRSRASCITNKRHHRARIDPLQSERAQRYRSKLNQASESSDSLLDQSCMSDNYESMNESTGCKRRVWRTTVPITPASRLQLLSPPPSPAVPSSSFVACEPIEEDVEMKLVVVSQSTPHASRLKTPPPVPRIVVSPSCRVASPTSADNAKLSQLSIAEIKPKRLDFSHNVLLHRTRATPDFTGRETVDILALLGDKSNHWRIVSKILSHLAPQDLCSVSMVSKTWRRICVNDFKANARRLTHIILRQNAKENLKLIKKNKIERDLQASPKSRYARKGCLLEVQNLLRVPNDRQSPSSPPVSPSKVKFHSFVKASRTLAPWEHLLPCPKCSFPCHVNDEKNVGTCSRQGCLMEFCTSCSSRPHTGPCKTPLLATPTKRSKRLVVGSRQSKRNLRRL